MEKNEIFKVLLLAGMFCRLCRQHKKAAKRGVAKRPFIENGCELYRVDYLDKHRSTQHHQDSEKSHSALMQGNILHIWSVNRPKQVTSILAYKLYFYLFFLILCFVSIGSSSVLAALEPMVVMEHEAVIGGFKCLYHLTKREQAHHTNYPALLELAKLLGCDNFKKLKVNAILLVYIFSFHSTLTISVSFLS